MVVYFFFNDPATTEIYTLSLHDALPIYPTDSNMAAPLLAKSFNPFLFAVISAIAFTTVLGTVSGLILAASGAVAHDLMHNVLRLDMDDHAKVRAGKLAAIAVGLVAMPLGIVFEKFKDRKSVV